MTNDKVFKRMDEKSKLMKTTEERRSSMVGDLLRHQTGSPPVSYTHLDVYKRQA